MVESEVVSNTDTALCHTLGKDSLEKLYRCLKANHGILPLEVEGRGRNAQDKLGERLTSLDNQQTDVAKVVIEEIVWRCTSLSRSRVEQPYGRPPAIRVYALGSTMPIFSWSALPSDCSDVLAPSVVSMPLSSDGLDGLALVKRCFVSPTNLPIPYWHFHWTIHQQGL